MLATLTKGLAGVPPIGNCNTFVEVATAASGYTPLIPVGTIITAMWPGCGTIEAIRLSIPTSTAVAVGTLATWDASFGYVALPNTANLGVPVAVATMPVASNATYVQYAWFAIAGIFPILSGASVAADTAIGITAAGKGGAVADGKQLLNCIVRTAATRTVAKTGSTQNGSKIIRVPDTTNWFVGLPISGTGIAASSTIATIDPDDRTVTLNNNATATGTVTITGTYNDGSSNYWNTCIFDRLFAQGQDKTA